MNSEGALTARQALGRRFADMTRGDFTLLPPETDTICLTMTDLATPDAAACAI